MTIYKKDKLPKEFLDEMRIILKDEYEDFIKSYLCEKTNSIRINTNKIDIEEFKSLKLFDIDFEKDNIPWTDIGFYVKSEESNFLGKNLLHDAGAYYIQEPSAMSVVGETDINEGEYILDLCAAPGGKSTYILSKLNGSGILILNEIDKKRILSLGENIERFGFVNSIIINSNSKELLKFFKGFFDKVFVDAPCSGQGMFRKDDFAIEDWSEEKVLECTSIQKEIIEDSYMMLKEGGMLIYSTCTFTKRENEDIINDFLNRHSEAVLLNQKRLWPHKERGEGHFCARIKKLDSYRKYDLSMDNARISLKENHNKVKKINKSTGYKIKKILGKNVNTNLKSDEIKYFEDFCAKYLHFNSSIFSYLNRCDEYCLYSKNNILCLKPLLYTDLSKLKTLRQGLILGEFKKNRFEPSHSFAMALSNKDVINSISFSNYSEEAKKYILGQSIDTGLSRGWILVEINGVSIGWGKESNGTMKNKYPKGLRR